MCSTHANDLTPEKGAMSICQSDALVLNHRSRTPVLSSCFLAALFCLCFFWHLGVRSTSVSGTPGCEVQRVDMFNINHVEMEALRCKGCSPVADEQSMWLARRKRHLPICTGFIFLLLPSLPELIIQAALPCRAVCFRG